MSAQSLLDQLLRSGLSAIQNASQGAMTSQPRSSPVPTPGPGVPASAPARTGQDGFAWGTFGAGAASGGALAMLLGNKRARGYAGKALKVGSVAALGALAYKAYTTWQEQQARPSAAPGAAPAPQASPAGAAPLSARFATLPPPASLNTADRLGGTELEHHSRAMLQAMVAAAKADGHLDDRERSLVEAELHRLEADASVRAWIDAELRRPLDPAEVARAATTPELAAEIYLASVLVVDDTNTMERLYLQELARELRLPDGLKAQLEAQAQAV